MFDFCEWDKLIRISLYTVHTKKVSMNAIALMLTLFNALPYLAEKIPYF